MSIGEIKVFEFHLSKIIKRSTALPVNDNAIVLKY